MLSSISPAKPARQAALPLLEQRGDRAAAKIDRLVLKWLIACSGWAVGAAHASQQPNAQQQASDVKPTAQAARELVRGAADNTAQARLTMALRHAEAGQWGLAENLFRDLVREHPGWADAQNNLAVALAAQGDIEAARSWLESAVRSDPGFTSAHQNLGDAYLRLAALSYERALRLDRSRSALVSRLATLRAWHDSRAAPSAEAPPVAVSATTIKPAAARSGLADNAAPAALRSTDDDSATDDSGVSQDRAAVASAVDAWAGAWSRRDMEAYLGAYEADYSPNGVSRRVWELGRASRIKARAHIRLSLQNLRVSVDGDVALARFRQHYQSEVYTSVDEKVLQLRRSSGGRWLIARELARKASGGATATAQGKAGAAHGSTRTAAACARGTHGAREAAALAGAGHCAQAHVRQRGEMEPRAAEKVQEAVSRWALASQGGDLAAFVAHYSPEYAPADMTRAAWLRHHQTRIQVRGTREVRIEGLRVILDGPEARAAFRQSYLVGGGRALDEKVLWLRRHADGRWLITREAVGSSTLDETRSPM